MSRLEYEGVAREPAAEDRLSSVPNSALRSDQDGTAHIPGLAPSPHRQPANTVVAALASDGVRGLRDDEARRRLEQYGPNSLKSAPETPWWKRLLEQFENFLVIILLVAIVISVIEWVLQDPRETALPYEAIVILAIVILNAMLGFIQELRAEKSVRALMALAAPEATVIRDGERQRIATEDIVPGDIVLVEAGDKIPADARVIESANLQADEAPLTGESVPVSKEIHADRCGCRARRPPQHAVLRHRRHLWPRARHRGGDRHVDRGRPHRRAAGGRRKGAYAAAAGAGPHRQAAQRHHAGDLRRRVRNWTVQRPTFTLNVVLGLFLFAVALAVAAIPEALPAIVTVGLSLGVRRMAAANAIVRKLPAVETLGAATVICSDKTGTLTRNEMTVRAIADGRRARRGRRQRLYPRRRVHCRRERSLPNPRRIAKPCREDVAGGGARQRCAYLSAARGAGACRAIRPKAPWLLPPASSAWPSRARALPAHRGNPLHLGAQAPHHRSCSIPTMPRRATRLRQGRARDPAPENAATCGRAARRCRSATSGARSSCNATTRLPGRRCALWRSPRARCRPRRWASIRRRSAGRPMIELPEDIEDDLVLLGLVGMIDPPRAEAKAAVVIAKRAHIRSVMITGDHPATAEAIARELDIFEPGARTVTGTELRSHGRCRARRHRRERARVRARRSRAQAAHRRRIAAQGPYRRHDW